MATFTWDKTIDAPRKTVWDVLTDHRGISKITPVRKVEMERDGTPDPNGLGAIRKLIAVGPPIREEVIVFEPHETFSYKLLSGAPVRDHVGTVTLSDAGENKTHMHYRVDTTPTVPVVGGLVAQVVKASVAGIVSGIAKESQKRAGTA